MAKVAYRGRTGVEDGRHGEQERAGASRSNSSRGDRGAMGRKPDDGIVRTQSGPDSKRGGTSVSTNEHTTSENPRFFGDPPNTVAMPVVASGKSTPNGYRSTGGNHDYVRNGQLGVVEHTGYNRHPGHEKGSGTVLGQHDQDFYNELGGGRDRQEGGDVDESGSGPETYGKSIEGFGAGKSTFQYDSDFYNALDDTKSDADCQAHSGSGIFTQKAGGPAKKITGFTATDGEITGFV